MSELIALRVLLFTGELLAGSAVILSLAWGLAAQRSASARHLTWVGAFGALLALPVLVAILPSAFHLLLPALPRLPLAQPFDVVEMAALPAPQPGGFSLDAPDIALALGAFWILGVCAAATRLTVAAFCLSALKRRSRLFALPPQALPKVTATHRECELRLSEREVGPIAWGLFRPVILLPESATDWPRDRLHSVLLHELAHIRRRDWAVQALSHLVCALYWPNPLVWIGAKNLRREAEIAADDAVIVSGVRPSSYAGELLKLAAEFRMRRPPALANMALFMAEPSALEARVESVLAPTSLRTGVTPMDVVKIVAAGLFTAAAIAFACPSLAQDAQPAPVTSATLPPPSPDAPTPPDAPPAPEAPPAPPVPPAPPAPTADVEAPAPQHIHVQLDSRELQKLKHIDLKHVHIAVEQAKREAREAIRSARPEIERAVREAHVSEDAQRAVEAAQPEIDRAVTEAMKVRPQVDEAWAKARPEVEKAHADARAQIRKAHLDLKVEESVDDALKRAEIRIEAAESRDHDRETRREQHSEELDAPDSPDTPDTPDEN
jgi:beta-lactamase regulating signal transducer with metallopeptidase domain